MKLSLSTSSKLFATGATLGPVIDSLHNQLLLKYDILPITLSIPTLIPGATTIASPFFCSSYIIPPLLGITYVILGGIIPRLLDDYFFTSKGTDINDQKSVSMDKKKATSTTYRNKAILAVASTAFIIRLSEYLLSMQTTTIVTSANNYNLLILSFISFLQWAVLDQTKASLLTGVLTSIGGPLAELPFVATGCWHYLPNVADYIPIQSMPELGLSSITGPCYFAVCMDSIALARFFDAVVDDNDDKEEIIL